MSQSSPIPAATLWTMGVCIVIYCWQVLVLSPSLLHQYTMNPRSVLYLHEYYRFLTSSLFHGSIMHISMNLMSLVAIGTSLEMHFGTLWIASTILWSIILTSAVYVLVAFSIYTLFGINGLMYSHSVGFSGVLFHLSVIQAYIHPNATRHLFGTFHIPSTAYPWALMVVLQMFMPNLSLLGHLSGIICGTCQSYGLLNPICMPGGEYLQSCDDRMRTVLTGYTPPSFATRYVNTSVLVQPPRQDTSALWRIFSSGCGRACRYSLNCWERVRLVVFGHPDARGNENIRFGGSDGVVSALGIVLGNGDSGDGEGGDTSDDDNPWIGLPPIPKIPSPPETAFV